MDQPESPKSSDPKGQSSSPDRLADLGARLAAARQRSGQAEEPGKPPPGTLRVEGNALGAAWRLSVELVSGVVVGGGVGWFLDQWLGTKPVLLIVFFFLGAAAGMNGVIRGWRQMNRRAEAEWRDR